MGNQQPGPIAQQLQKIQANGHQSTHAQQSPAPSLPPVPQKKSRWGFAGKTVWDWMNLIAMLLVPVVISVGSVWFSDQLNETNVQIALNQQREAALNKYMDDINYLLLEKGLLESKEGDRLRVIATMKTLLTLEELGRDKWIRYGEGGGDGDGYRKGKLLVFIYKLGLTNGKNPVIRLEGANLTRADLNEASLRGANLKGAFLGGADLWETDLREVDLSEAYLEYANVTNKQLSQVESLKGATLPNGSICRSDKPTDCHFNERYNQ